jgi:segregation and condensation protein B
LQVREEYSPWLGGLFSERPPRYSRALLETLALVAYRQPITRGEIEDVRGVVVSSNIVKTLMEREWIRVLGHREVPGRPALYGTTREFLDHFGLKSLEGLPPLADIRDLDQAEPDLFAPAPADHGEQQYNGEAGAGNDGDVAADKYSVLVDGESPRRAPESALGESAVPLHHSDDGDNDDDSGDQSDDESDETGDSLNDAERPFDEEVSLVAESSMELDGAADEASDAATLRASESVAGERAAPLHHDRDDIGDESGETGDSPNDVERTSGEDVFLTAESSLDSGGAADEVSDAATPRVSELATGEPAAPSHHGNDSSVDNSRDECGMTDDGSSDDEQQPDEGISLVSELNPDSGCAGDEMNDACNQQVQSFSGGEPLEAPEEEPAQAESNATRMMPAAEVSDPTNDAAQGESNGGR